jgi:hypothetical protein
MKRREFIKMGMGGLAFITAGSVLAGRKGGLAHAAAPLQQGGVTLNISLTMEEVMLEMVDKIPVYHWAYRDPVNGLRVPGSVIVAVEGDTLNFRVRNLLPGGIHSFAVPGIAESPIIPRGDTVSLSFAAPPAGTYMYCDPLQFGKSRAMGLHGMLIVLPRVGNTPYSNPTPAVQQLFNHLGTLNWSPGRGSAHYPGHPWDPDRSFIWIFHTVDSVKHEAVRQNPDLRGEPFLDGYRPDYFLISGKSGFFLSHDDHIGPHGNVGQPALIRAMNAGLNNASPHIHGNHVYMLAENNALAQTHLPLPLPANGHIHENVVLLETWTMRPGDRKDLLLPFMLPPDIPVERDVDFTWAPLSLEERIGRGGSEKAWPPIEEPFPLVYPMHDHDEISQTAAHGNYPQGAVLHWQIDGDIDMEIVEDVFGANRRQVTQVVPGKDGVILVDVADVNLATRTLTVTGRYSGLRGDTLTIFAGSTLDGLQLGQTTVTPDGTWAFVLTVNRIPPAARNMRTISIRNENTGATRLGVRFQIV